VNKSLKNYLNTEKTTGFERRGAGKMQKPINTRYKIAATE